MTKHFVTHKVSHLARSFQARPILAFAKAARARHSQLQTRFKHRRDALRIGFRTTRCSGRGLATSMGTRSSCFRSRWLSFPIYWGLWGSRKCFRRERSTARLDRYPSRWSGTGMRRELWKYSFLLSSWWALLTRLLECFTPLISSLQ